MIKKLAILVAVVGGIAVADIPDANAWPYRRVAPVRRVVTPPYPVARAVVAPPRYYARPYYAPPYVTGYRGPAVYGYGPGVSGGIYFGF
jgi:hypothetical protein